MRKVSAYQKDQHHIATMISTIKKTYLRKQLLEACIAKLQFTIDEVSERIEMFIERGQSMEKTGSNDSGIYSDADNNVSEINALNTALESANHDITLLENLKITQDVEREKVSLGAIVLTNHQNFFISAGIGKIIVNGDAYSCVSPKSPIYQEMVGMHTGDIFRYRSTAYKIREIL